MKIEAVKLYFRRFWAKKGEGGEAEDSPPRTKMNGWGDLYL